MAVNHWHDLVSTCSMPVRSWFRFPKHVFITGFHMQWRHEEGNPSAIWQEVYNLLNWDCCAILLGRNSPLFVRCNQFAGHTRLTLTVQKEFFEVRDKTLADFFAAGRNLKWPVWKTDQLVFFKNVNECMFLFGLAHCVQVTSFIAMIRKLNFRFAKVCSP